VTPRRSRVRDIVSFGSLFDSRRLLAACGRAGPDLSGVYQTSSNLVDSSGCGPGTAQPTSAYFSLSYTRSQQPWYAVSLCDTADPSQCSGISPTLSFTLDTPIADGWQGSFSLGVDFGQCELQYRGTVATLNGTTLQLEYRGHAPMLPAGQPCTNDEAKSIGPSSACVSYAIDRPASQSIAGYCGLKPPRPRAPTARLRASSCVDLREVGRSHRGCARSPPDRARVIRRRARTFRRAGCRRGAGTCKSNDRRA